MVEWYVFLGVYYCLFIYERILGVFLSFSFIIYVEIFKERFYIYVRVFNWKYFIKVCENLNVYFCCYKSYIKNGYYGFFIFL